ncbi:hypothetical protein QTJ16_007096 [Diplocarpon rosae]|uniref:Alpha/beta hydrolase fold-3 domain-containing protein n=1 Tax=Diplocarpon rosae TaxID=946125 RepID=A0AAD9SV47_9HELO|nr:hypothetical protein QTJ16_007096 [Diplocarpon rosae]
MASTSSIRVENRQGRSVANAAAQHLIKPFAPLILKPGDRQPAGSPRLTPHPSADGRCTIREWQKADTWIYTFSQVGEREGELVSRPRHLIYYFAGGGFRGAPTKEHWLFCAELCQQLPEYQINLISSPLAPNSPASSALPHLERLYDTLACQSRDENSRITLLGDSSGGNVALVLALYAASEYLKMKMQSPRGLCPVAAVMAICPAVDLRNEHPDIDRIQAHDPVLSRKTIEEVGDGWRVELSAADPRVSPALADLTLFQRAGVKVDGLTAGYDVLTPDALRFRDKLAEAGVDGDWLHWEKQMHCFPLMSAFHVHEGVAGKDWMVDVLRGNLQHG